MATLAKQTVETGNRIYIMIKNEVIGRAQSLTGDRSFGTEGVYELGSIMPHEHVFLKYTGTVSVERYRLRTGNMSDKKITALGEDVLKIDILDINVKDNQTGALIICYRGCSINTYSETYRANDITGESAQFYYLTSSNLQNGGYSTSQFNTASGIS